MASHETYEYARFLEPSKLFMEMILNVFCLSACLSNRILPGFFQDFARIIPDFARMLPGFAQDSAGFCQGFPRILQEFCQDFPSVSACLSVKILPGFFRIFLEFYQILPGFCQDFAEFYQNSARILPGFPQNFPRIFLGLYQDFARILRGI